MSKTRIEWTDYSINPVKGLCPTACSYCYARAMYKRFKWNPEITYDNTVFQKLPGGPGDRYFVGSTMELFGDWIDPWQMDEIFGWVNSYPKRTFIFLTKQPQNLIKWSPFPDNCWVGVSATNQMQLLNAMCYLYEIEAKVKFLSFEPLLDNIEFDLMQKMLLPNAVDWIIIGAETKSGKLVRAHAPKMSWIQEILVAASNSGNIPVFMKNNLQPLLTGAWSGWKLRQEMPNGKAQDSKK
jgi:protein gp37